MKWRSVTINGGIIVPIIGCAVTLAQQNHLLGAAGWVVALFAFVRIEDAPWK